MKKNIIYVLLIVLIMGVSAGCKKTETKNNEIMEEDNGELSENTLGENESEDMVPDNNESSDSTGKIDEENDKIETDGKESDSKENGETETGNTETESKGTENTDNKSTENVNKETENKDSGNKESGSKGTGNKESENKETENKGTGNKESGNKETENKGTGNKESGNKETGNKGTGNKESGNKESGNKESGNKETGNKENGNKETGNKGNGDKETDNSKDKDKQDVKEKDLLDIIKKIYEIKDPGLRLDNASVDLSNEDSVKYYTGLTDSSKVKKIAASEAMILSHAYSLVLVQLNDVGDAEKVANDMLNGIDTRKWICVGADDLQVVSHDDVIMLFMVSSTLEESVTSKQIVAAFKEVSGGKLDIELKK
ncbi:hypothetical protein [Anaerocolumna sp.]|uniref:hypothetical protein n=1 Tax=Anaerocolumna sp. TaxID=2041569 RepID=UPI0028AB088C|nr:hypothetical protein [Anaerocolumna sp.]